MNAAAGIDKGPWLAEKRETENYFARGTGNPGVMQMSACATETGVSRSCRVVTDKVCGWNDLLQKRWVLEINCTKFCFHFVPLFFGWRFSLFWPFLRADALGGRFWAVFEVLLSSTRIVFFTDWVARNTFWLFEIVNNNIEIWSYFTGKFECIIIIVLTW